MKRVLISQNEKNNGTDYLIVDGKVISDKDAIVDYGRKISKTDIWEVMYNDEFLEVRKDKNQLLVKSHYLDKDVVGRQIYYLYLVDDSDNLETILNYLEEDSKLINRSIDKIKTLEIIDRLKNNNKAKKKIIIYLLLILGISLITYLTKK